MDDLKEVILLMPDRDKNNFTRFLHVGMEKDNRDDLALFQKLLLEDRPKKGKEFREKKETKNQKKEKDAYHQNRKRLMEKLTDYYVMKSHKEDITGASKVMGLMTVSKYLFEAKMNRLGWKMIRKAEKLGWESDQYNLLNSIYLIMIEYADSFHATDIKTLIRKKTEAYRLAQQEESILMATQIIKQKLHEVKTNGKSLNFSAYLNTISKKFKISEAMFQNPKHLFNIIQQVRSSYLANRNLKQFESFVIEQYKTIESKFGFRRQHQYIKIEMEFMLAHVLYLNRKYDQSLQYLHMMFQSMLQHNKTLYSAYYPRYISLLSSIKAFTGKNTEAIDLLEQILVKDKKMMTIKDELNMHLSLAVFYNFNHDYEKTHLVFKKQKHSDEWIENKMGKEFVVRKNMAYALNLYDMGMEEQGLAVLLDIIETYAPLLELPQYEKVKVYIDMLITYFNDPDDLSPKEFMLNMNSSGEKFSIKEEENKTIAFFGWLLAKVRHTDYYHVVMEMVKS